MKRSDLNHLRRLIAWVQCEIGQSPDELVQTVTDLAARGVTVSDEGKVRLVQAHDKARSVPKYVRAAVKALDAYARPPAGPVVEARAREVLAAIDAAKGESA